MPYEISGITPSGTHSTWTEVYDKDLGWFKNYLGDSYRAKRMWFVVRNRNWVKFSVVDSLIPDDHAWMIDRFTDEQEAIKFRNECEAHYDEFQQEKGE